MNNTLIPVSLGLGGAVGYMLGGLDWTGTALGQAFKSQEQVLFLFAGVIFITSVTLHMFSIPEQPFTPSSHDKDTGSAESTSQCFFRPAGHTPLILDVILEEDAPPSSREDKESDTEDREMDFLAAERVRSKSDSVLAMPDATIELDPDLDPETQIFLPELHWLPETHPDLEAAFQPSGTSPPPPPAFSDSKDPIYGYPSHFQISSGFEDIPLRRVKAAVIIFFTELLRPRF